ncbi:MAG: hypothetical protein DCE86_05465 [Flavobacteriaceae bacterium]|nr:MAG: hypothetical protein DCE86_05465 [Flavobacteriaceae bacterium]
MKKETFEKAKELQSTTEHLESELRKEEVLQEVLQKHDKATSRIYVNGTSDVCCVWVDTKRLQQFLEKEISQKQKKLSEIKKEFENL